MQSLIINIIYVLVQCCIVQMDFQYILLDIDRILHDWLLDIELHCHMILDMDLYICCWCKQDLMDNQGLLYIPVDNLVEHQCKMINMNTTGYYPKLCIGNLVHMVKGHKDF